MINIKNVVDEPTIHDHRELTIKKTDIFMVSGVYPRKKVADLDSLDLNPDHKGGSKQRAAVHEFGHMLGFREEYPNPNETKEDGTPKRGPTDFTDAWTLDEESVMYNGETVRERHYAPFAGWLNKVFAVTLEKDGYKVAGLWTVSNSKL